MFSRRLRWVWAVGTVIGNWVMGGPRSGKENIPPVGEYICRARGDDWSSLAAAAGLYDCGEGEVGKDRFVGEGEREYRDEGDTDDPGVRRPLGVDAGTRRDGEEVFRLVGEDDNVRFNAEGNVLADVTVGERPMGEGMVSPLE